MKPASTIQYRSSHVLRGTMAAVLLTGLILVNASRATAEGFAVLVNAENSTESLSMNELRDIFQGDHTFWAKNAKILLVMGPKGSPERGVSLKRIYEKTESQYKRHWIGKIFRGEAVESPKEIPGSDTLLQFLSKAPGAIAIVREELVTTDIAGVKALKIDDKGPGDAGYPLSP